jgi:mxaJ protein
MVWDIGMGVRRDDEALQRAVSGALIRRRAEIAAILRAYRVPRLDEVPVDGGTP